MFTPQILHFWIATTLLKFLVLAACWNGAYRCFRWYAAMTAFKSAALWSAACLGWYSGYFWAYSFGGWLELSLLLCAVVELAQYLILPLESLPNPLRGIVRRLITFVILALALVALLYPAHSPLSRYAVVRTVERFSFAALFVSMVVLAALSRSLRMPWRNRPAWIGLGMGVYLAVQSVAAYLPRAEVAGAAAYALAQACWVTGFLLPDTPTRMCSVEELQVILGQVQYRRGEDREAA